MSTSATSTDKEVIEFLHRYGHLNLPFGVEQDIPENLSKLTLKSKEVKEAVRSHQSIDENYEVLSEIYHHRPVSPDGIVGPVTRDMINLRRCGMPDYTDVEPAVGVGNWKRCHGVGEFHAASIKVMNAPPSWLAPLFPEIQKRITATYADVGLLLHWDGRAPVNIQWHFVSKSNGWIGLAQVVNNATCASKAIWCQYLQTYTGGSTDAAKINQWTTLGNHEFAHNCGIGHNRGGITNPTIVNGLAPSWRNDVAFPLLRSRFGGVPVPTGPTGGDRKMVLAWHYPDGRFDHIMDVPAGGGFWPDN